MCCVKCQQMSTKAACEGTMGVCSTPLAQAESCFTVIFSCHWHSEQASSGRAEYTTLLILYPLKADKCTEVKQTQRHGM